MRVVILFSLYASLLSFFPLFSAKDILNFGEKIIGNESTLVSDGNNFELGFFTFNGSSNSSRSYLGIWYYGREPRTVVWVANRDNPVVDSIGVFQITKDGNLTISNIDGNICWASRLRETTPTNKTILKLEDSGNMVVSDNQLELWQSFDYPTDTFLVGMNMNEGTELISWRDSEDPGSGNFTFKLLAQTRTRRFIILRKPNQVYWLSEIFGSLDLEKTIPAGIVDLLTNFTMRDSIYSYKNPRREPLFSDYKDMRLVMNLTGHIQQQKWEALNTKWSLIWWKPADQCEQYNACGNFSSCNVKKRPPCSCLTGFNPKFPDNWSDGDFSGGCVNKSASCGQDTRFLDSKISKLFDPNSHVTVSNETECRSVCLSNCHQCLAYSYDEAQNVTRRSGNPTPPTCRIWSQDLPTLQENPDSGRNISVRVEISDRASIVVRACEPCGLNIIPYPLSTGPNCGDPMYLNFKCDNSTGQLSFISSMGSNPVTSINLQSRKLSIQVKDDVNYCAASASFSRDKDNLKFPFNVTNRCLSEDEIEVSWQSPSEPPCNKSMDCKDWIHSTCTGNEGGKRCLCDKSYNWDGANLTCVQKALISPPRPQGPTTSRENSKKPLSLIIVIIFASIIVFACLLIIAYLWTKKTSNRQDRLSVQNVRGRMYDSERHVKDLIDLRGLEENDNEGIEVPYYDFEIILAATNNFSDANKLGKGGYGPVYKGKLPEGQDIAVKRLSNVSSQGLQEFKNEAWRLWTENKLLDLMDSCLRENCNKNQFIKCVNIGLLCVQDEPGDRPTMSNVVTMLDSETLSLPTPRQPTFFMSRGFTASSSSSKPETSMQFQSSGQEGR